MSRQPPQTSIDDDDDGGFESIRTQPSMDSSMRQEQQQTEGGKFTDTDQRPALDPYVGRLERFELFCTNQCYYLVACDKHNLLYRVLKMDRTMIEHASDDRGSQTTSAEANNLSNDAAAAVLEASHRAKPTFRPLSDFLTEDPHTYTQPEIQDMLDMIHHGNQFTRTSRPPGEGNSASGGGLKPMAKGYGILGFIRFLDCYYLTLITRRAKVGSIGGNGIYTIKNTETFPLKPAEPLHVGAGGVDQLTDPSSMLLNMWNRGKRSVGLGLSNREIAELRYQGLYQVVDFTKNFYFSYTFDLTRSLQENFLMTSSQPFPPPPFKDMYAWNFFLTRELEECTSSLTSYHWVMPIIHGAFVQRKLSDYGRILNLSLVARRSRHFAGTRYLKRGVSEQGKVANDVEHEQILHDESSSVSGGAFSAFLQVRGSIPTYWTQESSVTVPKPPIELNRVDPTYRATQAHFEDLLVRYGSPVVVLDLVKQSEKREREVLVGNEFRHAVDYINTSIDDVHKIRYCALDYSHISKHRNMDVSSSLNEVSTWSVNQTGFFCSVPRWKITKERRIAPFNDEDKRAAEFLTKRVGIPVGPMEQSGVLRTNCIDCLDRTNVAQFSAGVEALEQQLVVMGIRNSPKLDPSSTIIRILIDMYVDIGDHIALQYGGSEAHKKVSTERSESSIQGPIGKHKELLTSIRRYYSNAFTDRLKQDAMNLLLGYYVPYRHVTPLWEMETDYWLHNLPIKAARGSLHSMKSYQRAFGVEWSDEDEEGSSERTDSSGASLTSTRLQRAKVAKRRSRRRLLTTKTKENVDSHEAESNEAQRISRVRERCKAQNDALSSWWKIAIQTNMQQRMWMQLGGAPAESMLPPRFERLYQPDKLAQFDRFFSRSWSTPVRRSHNEQHNSGGDDSQKVFQKSITMTLSPTEETPEGSSGQEDETLQDFYQKHSFSPAIAPSLKRFIGPQNQVRYTRHRQDVGRNGSELGRFYVGKNDDEEVKIDEFVKYADHDGYRTDPAYRDESVSEFSSCLHDTSLHSDDVEGIRRLAESAHIGSTIRSGPYKGLSQDVSAIEVTTLIHEQFNALSNLSSRPDFVGGFQLVDVELRRRGYYTVGVREAVARGWEQQKLAKQQYAEIVDSSNLGYGRSDLTTEGSMRLYASFFHDSTQLSQLDLTYMVGDQSRNGSNDSSLPSNWQTPEFQQDHPNKSLSFVDRASKLGISIRPHSRQSDLKLPPLFTFDRTPDVPEGFEQINEELFARKDNKFMVFNGAGVDSWHGTEPKTKILTFEKVKSMLETLGLEIDDK